LHESSLSINPVSSFYHSAPPGRASKNDFDPISGENATLCAAPSPSITRAMFKSLFQDAKERKRQKLEAKASVKVAAEAKEKKPVKPEEKKENKKPEKPQKKNESKRKRQNEDEETETKDMKAPPAKKAKKEEPKKKKAKVEEPEEDGESDMMSGDDGTRVTSHSSAADVAFP
jgi:outer membrane biosynthesis protein TonB